MNNKIHNKNREHLSKISSESESLLDQLKSDNRVNDQINTIDRKKRNSQRSALLASAALCSGLASIAGVIAINQIISPPTTESRTSKQSHRSATLSPKATTELRGSVGYPGSGIPKMAICSVDTASRSETCEEFPASNRNYEYMLSLDAPGEYWVYWTPKEWALKGRKFWIGECPPDRSGACSEFRVTRFQAHPKITSIPNIEIGRLNPNAPLIFE